MSFKLEVKAKRMVHLTSKCYYADKGEKYITEAAKSYNSYRVIIKMRVSMTWEDVKRQHSLKKILEQKQGPH